MTHLVIEQLAPGELTVPGAARRANVPESVVRYAIATGELTKVKRWGRLVVREPELQRFIERRALGTQNTS